jgi:rubrerythrin
MDGSFSTIGEILDFAIADEIEAHDFYIALAGRMVKAEMKKVFEQFATEELGHKMKLEAVKAGELVLDAEEEPPGLNIAEYAVDVEPQPDMSYLEALLLAMKKEKAAYRLYVDLAAAELAEELTNMFLALAAEEAKHKLRFELEYDAQVME